MERVDLFGTIATVRLVSVRATRALVEFRIFLLNFALGAEFHSSCLKIGAPSGA